MMKNKIFAFVCLFMSSASGLLFECHRSANCNCMTNNNEQREVEFTCNAHDDTTTSIRTLGNLSVEIQCSYNTTPTFPPNVQMGPIQNVEVSYCRLTENLARFLSRLGIESVGTLSVDDGILQTPRITRSFLEGLENLTYFSMPSSGIKEIEEDAFCEIPLLTDLDLTRNSINLTPDIFDCLQDLLVLELASSGIRELPGGVFKHQKKLRVLHLWNNHLKVLQANTFEGLAELGLLELSNNELEALPDGIFDSLTGLNQLNLSKNKIKVVPTSLFARNLNVKKIRWDTNPGLQLQEDTFANLPILELVSLFGNDFASVPETIFRNSSNIQSVNLAKNRLTLVPEALFQGLEKLKSIDLSENLLEQIGKDAFASLKSLETLYLQKNRLSELSRQLFDNLYELRTLRLDYNQIHTLPGFIHQKSLKSLNASHNSISFKANLLGVTPLNQCTELEELDLSFNRIADFEEDFMVILVKLRVLDLSFNNLTSVDVKLLQRMDYHERRINLSNNNISLVDFSRAEIMARLQDRLDIMSSNLHNTVVCISNNPISCDCQNYDLARYYHDELDPRVPTMVTLLKEDVYCASSDQLVAELPPRGFNCDLSEMVDGFECPQNCSCEWRPFERGVVVGCADAGLEKPPRIEFPDGMVRFDQFEVDLRENKLKSGPTKDEGVYGNVTRLLLSHNEIERVEWIPPKLEVLRLDNNELTELDYGVMKSLNGSHLRNLSLDRNPWKCSCSTLNLTKFIIQHLKQIENPNITCNASSARLLDLSEKDLCKTHIVLILCVTITIICIFLLGAVGAALFYRNQQVIKVWLFTHNLLLWWVTEEEVDKDKKYDVFVCFSHKDDDFVQNQLLPRLEHGPEKYKVCIHYRDWIAGEFIATQIADSVQNSRRTLIVLSRNFLDSVWGKMEFRIAHKQSMAEGRARVIVMVYGDVDLKQDLDEELKAYIKTNTYIKWDDPWFWNRLKYALPHPQEKVKGRRQANILQTLDDKFKLVEPSALMNQSTPPVLQMDSLKASPLSFTIENEKTGGTADAGLNPLLK